jgi:hypothetical protein
LKNLAGHIRTPSISTGSNQSVSILASHKRVGSKGKKGLLFSERYYLTVLVKSKAPDFGGIGMYRKTLPSGFLPRLYSGELSVLTMLLRVAKYSLRSVHKLAIEARGLRLSLVIIVFSAGSFLAQRGDDLSDKRAQGRRPCPLAAMFAAEARRPLLQPTLSMGLSAWALATPALGWRRRRSAVFGSAGTSRSRVLASLRGWA